MSHLHLYRPTGAWWLVYWHALYLPVTMALFILPDATLPRWLVASYGFAIGLSWAAVACDQAWRRWLAEISES